MTDGPDERLKLLLEIGSAINAGADLSVALGAVCKAACSFGWDAALVVLWRVQGADSVEATLAAAAGFSSEARGRLAAWPPEPAGMGGRPGHAYAVGGGAEGPVRTNGWEPSAGLLVPIGAGGEQYGALAVDRPHGDPSEDAVRALGHLADLAAVAIRVARVGELLQTQALTDPATGLANRRGFDDALRREVERAYRVEVPLSVLAADLDRLGRIKEAYGEAAGDEVIRVAAGVFREMLRQVDVVAHVGSGGFLALLPGANADRAREVAERLRCGIAAANVPGVGAVTATLGVASLIEHAANGAGLVQAAAAALALGKRRGRNRVAVAIPIGKGWLEGGADRRRREEEGGKREEEVLGPGF
jgi:diguanylate cyclase (GGDEF)-like protein